MNEEVSIRAIAIGASIAITLSVITMVMYYYSNVKVTVSQIGEGLNLANSYNNKVESVLTKKEMTGEELKNLLNYYYKNTDVTINIRNIYSLQSNGKVVKESKEYLDIMNNKETYNYVMKKIITNAKYKIVDMSSNDLKFVINIEGE